MDCRLVECENCMPGNDVLRCSTCAALLEALLSPEIQAIIMAQVRAALMSERKTNAEAQVPVIVPSSLEFTGLGDNNGESCNVHDHCGGAVKTVWEPERCGLVLVKTTPPVYPMIIPSSVTIPEDSNQDIERTTSEQVELLCGGGTSAVGSTVGRVVGCPTQLVGGRAVAQCELAGQTAVVGDTVVGGTQAVGAYGSGVKLWDEERRNGYRSLRSEAYWPERVSVVACGG